ncbi:MAG: DivIVA domain-containing protein [Cellulosilyticaceae bacterium]
MLSPVDIQNKEFRKAKIGGYNADEVNDFLEEVLQAYQMITKENYELKEKINMLNENIQYYRTMESTIQNALVLAEKTAQDTKSLAYEKASQIKREAEQRAETTLEQARQEIYMLSHKIDELKQQYLGYKVQIKQILQTQLEMLEQQNIGDIHIDLDIKMETNRIEEMTELEVDPEEEFYTKEYTFVEDDNDENIG